MRQEMQVPLPEFVRTVSNRATRLYASGTKVSYYKGRFLIGYNIEVSRGPKKCVRIT